MTVADKLRLVADDRLAIWIGPRRIDYYQPVFERLVANRNWASWNWSAFAFGPLWALYRRMYLLAIGTMVLGQIVQFSAALLPEAAALTNTFIWGPLLFGCFGNRALLHHATRKLAKDKASAHGPNKKLLWAIVLVFVGSVILA